MQLVQPGLELRRAQRLEVLVANIDGQHIGCTMCGDEDRQRQWVRMRQGWQPAGSTKPLCMRGWHAQTMFGVSSQVPPTIRYFYFNIKVFNTPKAKGKLNMPDKVDRVTKAAT